MKIFNLKIVSVLIISQLALNSASSQERNDLSRQNLKGKVKKMVEIRYTGVGEFGYFQTTTTIQKSVSLFDAQGFLISAELSVPGDTSHQTVIYKHDEKGNITESDYYRSDRKQSLKIFNSADEKGNIIESKECFFDGKIYGKRVNKYDSKGQLVETQYYDMLKGGALTGHRKFTNNESGNVVEIIEYDKNDKEKTHVFSKYRKDDKHGNWILRDETDQDRNNSVTEREFYYY